MNPWSDMKLLCILVLGACVFDSLAEGIGGQVVQKTECRKLVPTKKLSANRIQSYKLQTKPIKAVILVTKKGRKSCEDPNLKWVKKVMAQIDERNKQEKKGETQKKPRRKPKKN